MIINDYKFNNWMNKTYDIYIVDDWYIKGIYPDAIKIRIDDLVNYCLNYLSEEFGLVLSRKYDNYFLKNSRRTYRLKYLKDVIYMVEGGF